MLRLLHALSLVALFAVFESSCHKRRVAVPVPPPAQSPAPEATQPATAPPATAPAQTPPASPPKDEPKYQNNRPAPPPESQPPQAQPPRRPAQRPPNSPPPETVPSAQPSKPPRLGDILTPEQERQYNAAIDQSLTGAQASLGSIANHQLTKDQQGVVGQIQSFIQQAQATRKSNLAAARSLAERAFVLARDLERSLH